MIIVINLKAIIFSIRFRIQIIIYQKIEMEQIQKEVENVLEKPIADSVIKTTAKRMTKTKSSLILSLNR